MTPNEEYVLDTLARSIGGVVADGEDPPDGYIIVGDRRYAVEVSRLVETVSSDGGESRSRLADDIPALKMSNQIEEDLAGRIPSGVRVLLGLSAPINNIRKTRFSIQERILHLIRSDRRNDESDILGNRVSISIFAGITDSGKRISSFIANRYSSSNISENAEEMLKERISTKTLSRNTAADADEYLLALYNDYWVADIDSYKAAMRNINVAHDFDQIFVVDGYGRAEALTSLK